MTTPDVLDALGFPRVLEVVQRFAGSEAGKRRLADLRPSLDAEEVARRLDRVREARRMLAESGRRPLASLGDPGPLLARLEDPRSVLEPAEFVQLRDLLRLALELKQDSSGWPLLGAEWAELPDPAPALAEIGRVLDEEGQIREDADPELARVRSRGARAKKKLVQQLEKMLAGPLARFAIAEPFVTQRNERFVVPVRVEHRREAGGLIHGTSSSGATVFVEPLEAVDANNEWIYCLQREKEIVHRLLVRLTAHLRQNLPALGDYCRALARFDAWQSQAAFAEAFSCTVPSVEPGGGIQLAEARHPLLADRLGERTVPLTLRLGDPASALIVSGPNAGGKTVCLKTVGLLVLMAQSGLPVPAREARFPLFRQVLADIGDRQSIAADLSTFSAHVLRIRDMLADLTPPSLVLLDELGTGTDPAYGAALGIAILEQFQREGVLLIATTHHLAIKQYAEGTPGAANASVGLDPETLRPDYRLRFGVSGESSALEIARQLGLPSAVLDSARRRLDSRQLEVEAFLERLRTEQAALQEAQREAERTRQDLVQTRARLEEEARRGEEQRRKEAEKSLARWQREFLRQAERFVKGSEDRAEAARLRSQARARAEALKEAFRREMAVERSDQKAPGAGPAADSGGLAPGDPVYDEFFRKRGRVVEIQGEAATVDIDGKRVTSPLERLRKLERKEVVRRPSPQVSLTVVEDTDPELNLIGQRVEEALEKADKYLDRAMVSQLRQVRIIHGFGKGRLKKALGQFLATHPHVSGSRVEGGSTVVDLRE